MVFCRFYNFLKNNLEKGVGGIFLNCGLKDYTYSIYAYKILEKYILIYIMTQNVGHRT